MGRTERFDDVIWCRPLPQPPRGASDDAATGITAPDLLGVYPFRLDSRGGQGYYFVFAGLKVPPTPFSDGAAAMIFFFGLQTSLDPRRCSWPMARSIRE